MMKYLVAVGLAGVAMVASAQAQVAESARDGQPTPIEGSRRYVVAATKSQTRFQVDVLRVDSTVVPVPAGFMLPVIYVLDGNSLFPLAAQMANVSTSFSSKLPAVLVVSIGYPTDLAPSRADNVKQNLARRTRDLSPPAADFLAFLKDDLEPLIAARYPVDRRDQTLAGHSMSGLFTAFVFLNAPDTFTRYVAISPSLFWDDHALIKQAGAPAARAARAPTRLFVAVGGLETKDRMGQDMIGDAEKFVTVLRQQNIPGLEVIHYVFPEENHLSVVPGALMRGLRDVGALR
jgi:uncharacterized protein